MSIPGHYNEVVLVGDVREVITDGKGAVIGMILMVDVGEPCEVPILLSSDLPGLAVGDRLWVRGQLAFDPMPDRRGLLHFVQARWVDRVKHARGV